MASPEGTRRQKDIPTPRYNSSELVAALFARKPGDPTPFDWAKFSPKEVRNTITGIIYQKAAQHIVHDLVTSRDEGGGRAEQMQGVNFIPTTVTESFPMPDRIWTFDHPSDLSTDGDPDFVKIQRYVGGLFRDYAGREFEDLEKAHPLVAGLYDEADRRLQEHRERNEDTRFTALDLGIDVICGLVNSSFQEAEAPNRPPALHILGGSMPLLISIARESVEGKGDPDSLGMIALRPDPRQKEKATDTYKSVLMRLSVGQALRLLTESVVDAQADYFDSKFREEYISSSLELIRRIGALTADESLSLSGLATAHPEVNDMLSTYVSKEADKFYVLRHTIQRLSADFPQLYDAYVSYFESDPAYDQQILNPKFFGYSADTGGFVHKLDDEGYSLYWQHKNHESKVLADIVPENIVTGCSGMMFNLRSDEEGESTYWSEFPKIPRHPIGLATTIAYIAARSS